MWSLPSCGPRTLRYPQKHAEFCLPIVGCAPHDSMIVDAFTKRHGNSVTMKFLRSRQISIVDEDKEVANRRTFREEHGPNLRFHRQREDQAHRSGGMETTMCSWLRENDTTRSRSGSQIVRWQTWVRLEERFTELLAPRDFSPTNEMRLIPFSMLYFR